MLVCSHSAPNIIKSRQEEFARSLFPSSFSLNATHQGHNRTLRGQSRNHASWLRLIRLADGTASSTSHHCTLQQSRCLSCLMYCDKWPPLMFEKPLKIYGTCLNADWNCVIVNEFSRSQFDLQCHWSMAAVNGCQMEMLRFALCCARPAPELLCVRDELCLNWPPACHPAAVYVQAAVAFS